MKTIIVKRQLHRGKSRLILNFEYDADLISVIRKVDDARWSMTMKCWHVPDNANMVSNLFRLLKGKAFLDYSGLKHNKNSDLVQEVVIPATVLDMSGEDKVNIEEFRKWMIHRRYSDSTINNYAGMLSHFLKFISPKESSEINSDDMVRFVNEYVIPRRLSYTFQNQVISAAKLFFRFVYKADLDEETFERPRRE